MNLLSYLGRFSILFIALILFLLSGFGCKPIDSDPEASANFRSQLRIWLEISEKDISPDQEFSATLSIRNVTGRSFLLKTGSIAIADITVTKGDEFVWITGTGTGGPGVNGYHYIDVGETYVTEYNLRARTSRFDFENEVNVYTPLESGEYVLNLVPQVIEVNGEPASLPSVHQRFWVK